MSQLLEINGCPNYQGMGTGTFKVPGTYPGRPGISRYLPQRVTLNDSPKPILGRPPKMFSVIEQVVARKNTARPNPKQRIVSGKQSNPDQYLSIALSHAKKRNASQAINFAKMAASRGNEAHRKTANAIINWVNTGLNLRTF